VFVATACPGATAVTKPVATITEILASNIASPAETWFPSPSELHRPTQAVPLVQRLAVQRRARRTSGSLMLLQFPFGGIVRCNGLFGGATAVITGQSVRIAPGEHARPWVRGESAEEPTVGVLISGHLHEHPRLVRIGKACTINV